MFLAPRPRQVATDASVSRVVDARVQQAFLPKFENEGQDASVADAIVSQADTRYMVVTIKHSGSLVTLSGEGFAAKNSLANPFTAGTRVCVHVCVHVCQNVCACACMHVCTHV